MFDALTEAGRDVQADLTNHDRAAIVAAVEHGLGVALLIDESIRSKTMRVSDVPPEASAAPSVKCGLEARRRQSEMSGRVVERLRHSVDALSCGMKT